MGMPLELNTLVVTKGREIRVEENLFELTKQDYRLYPIDVPLDIRKTLESDSSGTCMIKKVEWENKRTVITYQLVSLKSTN
jgi:hypothetical protein